MTILNLTLHPATPSQKNEGVVDLEGNGLERLKELLTFGSLPDIVTLNKRAESIALLAEHYSFAMIGGAPYLMRPLEAALNRKGISPLYAFSKRVSREFMDDSGVLRKTSEFVHEGFVDPYECWNDED